MATLGTWGTEVEIFAKSVFRENNQRSSYCARDSSGTILHRCNFTDIRTHSRLYVPASTGPTSISTGRGAMYYLYGSGIHGSIMPVWAYGLEILALNQELYNQLERFEIRTIHQLICLLDSALAPVLFILHVHDSYTLCVSLF